MQVRERPDAGSTGTPPRAPASPAGHRRRWVWLAIIALVSVLLLSAGLYVAHYEPLVQADGVIGSGGTSLGEFGSPAGGSFSVTRFAYQEGRTFYFGFGLLNSGRVPVTITSIHSKGTGSGSLVQETVWVASKDPYWSGPPGSPGGETFRPFTLTGGAERWVVFSERFVNCSKYHLGLGDTSSQSLARADVSFRVLGVHRTAVLPYDATMQVVLSSASKCA